MVEMIGKQGEKNLSKIGFTKQMVSMGHQSCGALELWNYPIWLRNLISQNVDGSDRPNPIDLPALESKSLSLSLIDDLALLMSHSIFFIVFELIEPMT